MGGNNCLTGALPVPLEQASQNISCNLGFFCPNNTSENPPEYCPPTILCQITRLQTLRNTCNESQGIYEPILCREGYYCPPGGREQIICPARHYCPLGTVEPIRCSLISSCPAGSQRQFALDGVLALVIIDLALLVAAGWPFLQRCWQAWRRLNQPSALSFQDPEINTEGCSDNILTDGKGILRLAQTSYMESPNLPRFVKSLTRCIGMDDIRFEIGFKNLSFNYRKPSRGQELILSDVSGTVKSGSLLAVMGASGAGKSTFVRVLMGKLKHTSGSIQINGEPMRMSNLKKIIGYVPQDDVVLPELTVRENLLHSARIRLPRTLTEAEIQEHVDILISYLQLTHIQHSPVGDVINPTISGGQRKRVSIGVELAAAPIALVLDEPTSGLDATSALSIIELLKALCRLGVTVVCIIHQPRIEIFQSLDRLLLLAKGQEVYLGEVSDVVQYFSTAGFEIPAQCNPADAIMDIISGQAKRYKTAGSKTGGPETVSELISHWKSRSAQQREKNTSEQTAVLEQQPKQIHILARTAATRGASWYWQAYLCFLRSLLQQSRQLTGFFLEIGVGAIAGLLIGLSVYTLEGLLFQGIFLTPFELLSSAVNYTLVPELGLLCSLAIGLAAAAPGVKTFGEEKAIYWREASSGHSRSAYFIGKSLSTLFRITLSSLHFTTFYAILATPLMPFSTLYAANLLYFYCIYGLASCVSMLTKRENGPLLAMIVSLIIGVFGGYGPPLSTIKIWHLEWAWRMCPGTWFSEAYFHAHTDPLKYLYDIDAAAQWTGYNANQMGLDMSMMLVIGTAYRVLAYLGLIFIDRQKQI